MARRAMKPGWYSDPAVPARFRFWDGTGWTRWLSARRGVGLPPAVDVAAVAPVEGRFDRWLRVGRWLALGLAVLIVALTVTGVIINRRAAAGYPEGWQVNDSPAPTSTLETLGKFELDDDSGSISVMQGAVTMHLPEGWKSEGTSSIDSIFAEGVFAVAPSGTEVLVESNYVGIGLLEWAVVPQSRGATAEGLAQLVAARLYGKLDGISYGEAETTTMDDFGTQHLGARSRLPVRWSKGSTVIEVRIFRAKDNMWVGWVMTDGESMSADDRAAVEAAWKKTAVRDS